MVLLNEPVAVFEDKLLIFGDAIWRQPTLAFTERHGAAGSVEADADFLGSTNLAVECAIVGKDVEMVTAGRAAGKRQFGQPGHGADVDGFVGEVGPDGIEGFEPGEQVSILGDDAG